jgi:hypothetical protein
MNSALEVFLEWRQHHSQAKNNLQFHLRELARNTYANNLADPRWVQNYQKNY